MNPNSKEFKALQDKWYAKLKKEGFDDIERNGGGLKTDPMQNIKTFYDQSSFEAKQSYHSSVGYFLHHHTFNNEKERLIWEFHSQGVSIRDTVEALQKKGYKTYKRQVHEILQKLVKQMYAGQL